MAQRLFGTVALGLRPKRSTAKTHKGQRRSYPPARPSAARYRRRERRGCRPPLLSLRALHARLPHACGQMVSSTRARVGCLLALEERAALSIACARVRTRDDRAARQARRMLSKQPSAPSCARRRRGKTPLLAPVGRSSGPGVRWTLGLQGALTECSAIESTKMVSHGTHRSSLHPSQQANAHADRH